MIEEPYPTRQDREEEFFGVPEKHTASYSIAAIIDDSNVLSITSRYEMVNPLYEYQSGDLCLSTRQRRVLCQNINYTY